MCVCVCVCVCLVVDVRESVFVCVKAFDCELLCYVQLVCTLFSLGAFCTWIKNVSFTFMRSNFRHQNFQTTLW